MSIQRIWKFRVVRFALLSLFTTLVVYLLSLDSNSYTDNIPFSLFWGFAIAGSFWWLVTSEMKDEEFVIGGLVYNTANAKVVATGKNKSKFLGATFGAAAWQESQAIFYQTKNGALFSIEHSHILEMALFVPVPRSHKSSCTPYADKEECVKAMVDEEYGGLSAVEASQAVGVTLENA